jgi:hypothetical protein
MTSTLADYPMRKDGEDPDLEKGRELVDIGANSLGALVGAGVGLAFGPPGALAGAVGGPAVVRALRWAGHEIRARLLSSNEEARIGSALLVAMARIEERREAGEQTRQDGLFEPGEDPEGLLEGTLLSAARSYDQKKVPFIGAFYASFAFAPDVSPLTAHFLLRLLDRLTYRQLCALAYLADPERQTERGQIQAAGETGSRTSPTLSAELNDLANQGLIGYKQEDGQVVNPYSTVDGGGITARTIARTVPTALGTRLTELAELHRVPAVDQQQIVAALTGEAS